MNYAIEMRLILGRAQCKPNRGRGKMRKQLLSVFLPLLAMVMVAPAETPVTGAAATGRSALEKVNVTRTGDGYNVELTARGPITPKLTTLDSPARLVLDLPNTVAATARGHISVANGDVKDVRIGMDGQNPPTTRVVVDLIRACQYEIGSADGNRIVLKLHDGNGAAQTASKAAPANVVPVAPAKVMAAATAPVSSEPTTAAPSKVANSFVVVEPTYTPKDASAPSAGAPAGQPVRAVEAASKFVERPEESLLPSTSAAMQQSNPNAIQPAVNLAAEQKAQDHTKSSINGPKYTGEPISVNLKDVDLKDFFRLIHEISGLNVVLDPNVHGTLTIVLDDVPWDQALDIVLKNNQLDRQLEGNVLRIATIDTLRKEAEARRAQVEAEALAVDKTTVTRFLSYAHSKDVVLTVRKFLSQRGDAIADERTNAIIISDIPSVIPNIDRLLGQLDRKTQEVEIEARVVAATRTFARDIGTQLGFGWGNGPSAVGGNSSVGQTQNNVTYTGPPGYFTIPGFDATNNKPQSLAIPLFSNLALTQPTSGFSIINVTGAYRLDTYLTMAESRGLLKILSRPRVVTQNNIQALVRQGVRVPIVTQAQLGGPPTVTYVDAFLRLTVVPQITAENTIFLNVDVENTTPDFGREVQGNPTLITQQATTQVLVTDGGTVVIGGVIQTQNSITIDQVPLLGSVPWLGNLFKHTQVSTSNQELIFFLSPRIIQT